MNTMNVRTVPVPETGLAVRYDWRGSYLRFSFDQPLRSPRETERLRLSAGVRF